MVRSRAAKAWATNARRCSASVVSRSIAATMKACGDVPAPAATADMRCFNSAGSFRVVAGMVDPPPQGTTPVAPRCGARQAPPNVRLTSGRTLATMAKIRPRLRLDRSARRHRSLLRVDSSQPPRRGTTSSPAPRVIRGRPSSPVVRGNPNFAPLKTISVRESGGTEDSVARRGAAQPLCRELLFAERELNLDGPSPSGRRIDVSRLRPEAIRPPVTRGEDHRGEPAPGD